MEKVKWMQYEDGTIFKLTYVVGGGFYHEDVIKVRIMKNHEEPKTFFEKLFRNWKYTIAVYEYSPLNTNLSLGEYCDRKWTEYANKLELVNTTQKEWNKI